MVTAPAAPRGTWRVSWVTPNGASSRDFDSEAAATVWAASLTTQAMTMRAFVSVAHVHDSEAASGRLGPSR